MTSGSLVKACYDDLKAAAALLKTDERECREYFNSRVFSRYEKEIASAASPLRPFFFIFQQLDEYLNDPGARALGQGNADDILDSCGQELDEALREALLIEKGAQV